MTLPSLLLPISWPQTMRMEKDSSSPPLGKRQKSPFKSSLSFRRKQYGSHITDLESLTTTRWIQWSVLRIRGLEYLSGRCGLAVVLPSTAWFWFGPAQKQLQTSWTATSCWTSLKPKSVYPMPLGCWRHASKTPFHTWPWRLRMCQCAWRLLEWTMVERVFQDTNKPPLMALSLSLFLFSMYYTDIIYLVDT